MNKLPEMVRKRDGASVRFDENKIVRAIQRAALEVLMDEKKSEEIARSIKKRVLSKILSTFPDNIPSVENIQDIVEEVLMETGYGSIARSYILYRQEHQDIRHVKVIYGVRDDLKLPINTLLILKNRYLQKDDNQDVTESPKELFERVALAVSEAESDFRSKLSNKEVAEKFFQMFCAPSRRFDRWNLRIFEEHGANPSDWRRDGL